MSSLLMFAKLTNQLSNWYVWGPLGLIFIALIVVLVIVRKKGND